MMYTYITVMKIHNIFIHVLNIVRFIKHKSCKYKLHHVEIYYLHSQYLQVYMHIRIRVRRHIWKHYLHLFTR